MIYIYGKRSKIICLRKWTNIRFEGGPRAFVWLCVSMVLRFILVLVRVIVMGHLQRKKHVRLCTVGTLSQAPLSAFLMIQYIYMGAQSLDSKIGQVDKDG